MVRINFWNKCLSVRQCDLYCWYFNILNLLFSTGPCSPMRETVMIFAWQKKEVSRYYSFLFFFMIATRYYQMRAGISLSAAYSCSTGTSAQRDCVPLLSHPIICRGKNVSRYTTDHSNSTFPQCLCFRWRTGGVGWGTEQWKSDVCFLQGPGSQFWSAQICPHQLGLCYI